ncbi:MAG TPA: CHAD domain-containing protein [Opitutaceae bacterium]
MMSFRLHQTEATAQGIRRVCLAELEQTCAGMVAASHDPVALHEVRKQLKKLRAALDLAQPAFGRAAKTEAKAIQGVARLLAQYRETEALLILLEREARIAGSADFDFLETSVRLHQIAHRPPRNRSRDVEAGSRQLAEVKARLEKLSLPECPEGLFRRRFRKSYKDARDACNALADKRNGDALHHFRKVDKRLLNQARLFQDWGGERFADFRKKLVQLDDLLGRARDCANLAAILRGVPAAEAPLQHGFGLRTRLESASAEATQAAMVLAARVYRRSSRKFIARMLG